MVLLIYGCFWMTRFIYGLWSSHSPACYMCNQPSLESDSITLIPSRCAETLSSSCESLDIKHSTCFCFIMQRWTLFWWPSAGRTLTPRSEGSVRISHCSLQTLRLLSASLCCKTLNGPIRSSVRILLSWESSKLHTDTHRSVQPFPWAFTACCERELSDLWVYLIYSWEAKSMCVSVIVYHKPQDIFLNIIFSFGWWQYEKMWICISIFISFKVLFLYK